jgi:hypothetical protein
MNNILPKTTTPVRIPTIFNSGTSVIPMNDAYASAGYIEVSNTGGSAYAFMAAAAKAPDQKPKPKQYPRQVLRKLETIASGPLDHDAPVDEKEFLDWLNSD